MFPGLTHSNKSRIPWILSTRAYLNTNNKQVLIVIGVVEQGGLHVHVVYERHTCYVCTVHV